MITRCAHIADSPAMPDAAGPECAATGTRERVARAENGLADRLEGHACVSGVAGAWTLLGVFPVLWSLLLGCAEFMLLFLAGLFLVSFFAVAFGVSGVRRANKTFRSAAIFGLVTGIAGLCIVSVVSWWCFLSMTGWIARVGRLARF